MTTTSRENACSTGEDAIYVYCVARGRTHWLLGPIGLDGHMVYTVPHDGLCCVVHTCPAKPYQSDDPQVVESWVVAHQRVIHTALDAFGAVLPMAFNMIVRGGPNGDAARNLKGWLAEKRGRFIPLLDNLVGKAEYGVQVFWDRQSIAGALVEDQPELRRMRDNALAKPKGLAYMLQQKLAKATGAALEDLAKQYVQGFYERIRQSVDQVHVDRLKKCDRGQQMLLNLSCLAGTGSRALGPVLEEIERVEGISVRFTGPWPPYSFVRAA